MSLDRIIHSNDFTDSNGELHYLNTGRDNVSGLAFPTHYIRNKDNYSYTRIIQIKLCTDTSLTYPIHECFLLTAFNNDNGIGVSNIITIDAMVKKSTVKESDINITCTPLNFSPTVLGGKIHGIKAALKNELNEDGYTIINLGIWLDTKDISDVIIKDISTLSYNGVPNNIRHQFLQCDYESYYLNNEDIMYDVNMFNFEESIGTKIAEGININQAFIDNFGNGTFWKEY